MPKSVIALNSKLYNIFYEDGNTDAIAYWLLIKNHKTHPFFSRRKNKRNGKPICPIRTISESVGISYNSFKKHFEVLVKYGLIKYDHKKVWCISSNASNILAIKENLIIDDKARVVIFKTGLCKTISDYKTVAKSSISITNRIKAINKCLKLKETIAKKNSEKSKVLSKKDKHFLVKDDFNEVLPYCGISNQYFATSNNRKSISTGNRIKKSLSRLGVITHKRKQLLFKSNCSYSEFIHMKSNNIHSEKLRFCNGTVYSDISSEIHSCGSSHNNTNSYFTNAQKNIITIGDKPPVKFDCDVVYDSNYGYILKEETLEMCPEFFDTKAMKKIKMLSNLNRVKTVKVSKSEIKKRFGWNKKMINIFSAEYKHCEVVFNKKSCSNYLLFTLSQVVDFEKTEIFKKHISKNYNRLKGGYLRRKIEY